MEQGAWEALKEIAKDESINARRPAVGRRVRVVPTPCSGPRSKARKLLGTEGTITWHGVDRLSGAWRYCDGMQAQLRDVMGRYGYRVRVQPDEGDQFFIGADEVCVL